jgi:hypothetical protein
MLHIFLLWVAVAEFFEILFSLSILFFARPEFSLLRKENEAPLRAKLTIIEIVRIP